MLQDENKTKKNLHFKTALHFCFVFFLMQVNDSLNYIYILYGKCRTELGFGVEFDIELEISVHFSIEMCEYSSIAVFFIKRTKKCWKIIEH